MNLDDVVDLGAFATETDGLSGAELASLRPRLGCSPSATAVLRVQQRRVAHARRIKPTTTPAAFRTRSPDADESRF